MSVQTEAMKLALEALENTTPTGFSMERDKQFFAAITALREAWAEQPRGEATLAQQSAERGEPVAYGMWDTMLGKDNRMMMVRLDKGQDGCTVPLYTAHGITSGEATKKGNT